MAMHVQGGSSPAPLARFSSLHTVKPVSAGGGSYEDQTVGNVLTAEAAYDAVQLAFAGASAETTPGSVTRAVVAPSSALGDGITPRNAAGAPDNTLWVPLTFDKGGRGGEPDEVVSGGTRLSFGGLPPRTTLVGSTVIDRPIFSDLVPLKSLSPTDGAYPYLFVRVYSAGRLHYLGGSVDVTDWNTGGYNAGRALASFRKAGDGVTSPSGFASGAVADNAMAFYAARFQQRRRGLSVMSLGDSTVQGGGINAATVNHAAPMLLACTALSTPDVPVSFANFAVSGSRSTPWPKQAQILFDAFRPDVVEIAIHTPNDPSDQASTDLAFAQALRMADHAIQQGIVPILSTPIPWNWRSGTLTMMLDLIARARAMRPTYAFVADRHAAVVDPNGTGGTTLPEYVSRRYPYHLLLPGNQQIASAAFAPILRMLIAGRPKP